MALLAFYSFDETTPDVGMTGAANNFTSGRTGNGWGMRSSANISFAASATLIMGCAIKPPATPSTGAWLTLKGDAGVTSHLALTLDATGHIELRRGATLLATSTNALAGLSWAYVEVSAVIHDTTGTCVVRVDGVEWINFTGDTKNGGTATTLDTITIAGTSGIGAGEVIFDDMYVCDGTGAAPYNTFLGDVKVETLLPDGNGASSQFVGSDGNSVDNYLLVDEAAPNTTDYVGSTTPGNRDLYSVANMASTSGTVLAVQAQLYAAKSDAGTIQVKGAVRSAAGTVSSGTAKPLTTSHAMVNGDIRTTDPDGAAWTITSVNAAQVGAEVA